MSIIFNKALYKNERDARIMQQQQALVQELRVAGNQAHTTMLSATNVARTPSEAYREMDSVTKIDQVPSGEFAMLTRVLGNVKPVNLGRKLYEYRRASEMNVGQSSMGGQTGVKSDGLDYSFDGAIVPIHDKGFGIDWRDHLAMQAEGFDELVDYSREADRGLMRTKNNYLWNGDAGLVFKGRKWLGLKADPSVAMASIAVDLVSPNTTADQIRNEIARIRDILRITNNCSTDLELTISREMASAWERPFSNAEGTFGTIYDMILKLRGIKEIYEDPELVGNELTFMLQSQEGFHGVSGMAVNTYAVPRLGHNSNFDYVKWCALGFISKQDFNGRKCALYATG